MNVLDRALNDYWFRLENSDLLRHEIQAWYRTHATGAVPVSAMVHFLEVRAGYEYQRWERELGAPLTLRKLLEDSYPGRSPERAAAPDPRMQFVDQGIVMESGDASLSAADSRLHGMISPCRVLRDERVESTTLLMLYVGADGDRADGGPAHRRLLLAHSSDGGASWVKQRAMKSWSPQGNSEEGIFSSTPLLYSAVSAANATTSSVWSDIRRMDNDQIVLDHRDTAVWGHGDELFVHSWSIHSPSTPFDGPLLYIAKGGSISWGLGERAEDGTTRQIINPKDDYERVVGGGADMRFVVLVRGFREGGSTIEFYDQDDLQQPIYMTRCGARHVTPYWDGNTWWLYGRHPGGNAIRRWRLEMVDPVAPDEIDLSEVTWLHADISEWRVTSQVTSVALKPRGKGVGVYHTGAGSWPEYIDGGVRGEGNIWIFGKINGQWYGATCEWLRHHKTTHKGQEYKPELSRTNIGPHTKQAPLRDWVPKRGETVGFAMSTPARSHLRTSNERSNVVLVAWP